MTENDFISIQTPDEHSSMKEWALWYAGAMHWHVFPIQAGQKAAFYPDNELQNPYSWKEQATDDLQRIDRYWTEHPHANIGLATGSASGVYVLDFDTAKADEGTADGLDVLKEWQNRTGLRIGTTVQSRTQSGGTHLFFIADKKKFKGKDAGDSHIFGKAGQYANHADGNDTRGTGNYVLLPPSRGQQGCYEWVHSPVSNQITTASDAFYEYWRGGTFNADGSFTAAETYLQNNSQPGSFQKSSFTAHDPGQSGRHNYLISQASHDSALFVRKGTLQHDDFIFMEQCRNAQLSYPLGTEPDDSPNEWEKTIKPHCEKVYAADDAQRRAAGLSSDFANEQEQTEQPLIIGNMSDYISSDMRKDKAAFMAYNNIEMPFTAMNNALGANVYPALYALVGGTSAGKTTFFLQIADSMAARKTPVLYFSLEQSRAELLSESMSRIANSSGHYAPALQIRKTNLDDDLIITRGTTTADLRTALATYNATIAPNMYIIEGNFNITVDTIRQTIHKFKEDHPDAKPVIFIDYLQILKQPDFTDTRAGADLNITNLKTITRDENVPIFLISSTARGHYTETGSLDAFKESGTIEYSCDVCMSLYLSVIDDLSSKESKDVKQAKIEAAENENPRNITLKIMKNRFGRKNQKIFFQYYPAYYRFIEKFQ